MRMSELLFQSSREVPAEAELASHRLLLRAAYIRQVAAGLFDYLPLGLKVIHRLEALIRTEMDAIGAQEVRLPVVQPADLWQKTGRWQTVGADLARFQDRAGRDLCLAMTHEEVATSLVAQVVQSYRQLPQLLYQVQTKFRDEPRPRGGLIRTREFTMKDAYSFHTHEEDLARTYERVCTAYHRIFERCALEVIAVESDSGLMGGSGAHEFMFLTPVGGDTLLLCASCSYKANRQVATFQKPRADNEAVLALEEIATPGAVTIQMLAEQQGITEAKTLKAVFFVAELEDAEETLVFAVVRGDMALNETKLSHHLRAKTLRPATVEEVRAIGAEPGYASPIGLKKETYILVADEAVTTSPNLFAGANRAGYHLRHTNYGRDYEADKVVDIAAAAGGDPCPVCAHPLSEARGVEVGNSFRLGTRYSEALGATFKDETGRQLPIVMGSYGIGVGRLLACIVERHHDEKGMCWPEQLSPFDVALIALDERRSPEVATAAEELYKQFTATGTRVLFDDRGESPGVKFNDADLLGLPWRVTVGKRGLERGTVELKKRDGTFHQEVAPEKLPELISSR